MCQGLDYEVIKTKDEPPPNTCPPAKVSFIYLPFSLVHVRRTPKALSIKEKKIFIVEVGLTKEENQNIKVSTVFFYLFILLFFFIM